MQKTIFHKPWCITDVLLESPYTGREREDMQSDSPTKNESTANNCVPVRSEIVQIKLIVWKVWCSDSLIEPPDLSEAV
jgi:hypothetical protein